MAAKDSLMSFIFMNSVNLILQATLRGRLSPEKTVSCGSKHPPQHKQISSIKILEKYPFGTHFGDNFAKTKRSSTQKVYLRAFPNYGMLDPFCAIDSLIPGSFKTAPFQYEIFAKPYFGCNLDHFACSKCKFDFDILIQHIKNFRKSRIFWLALCAVYSGIMFEKQTEDRK